MREPSSSEGHEAERDPRDPSDLIARAGRGDHVALQELMLRYLPSIRAYVRLNVNDFLRARESCSDVVQSVCEDVLRNIDRFEYRGSNSFRNWLYTAVLNKVRMHERHFRAQKRSAAREHPGLADAAVSELSGAYMSLCRPSHNAAQREELERVESAFARLPEKYREVLSKSRIVGLSHAEIAAASGSTPGAVAKMLNRAIVRLTEELDR